MASELEVVPLTDLYEFGSGLSKARSEFGRGFPFLSFKDVFQHFFVPDELNELVNSTIQEQTTCSVQRGDVFLTRTSETMDELGMSCVALKTLERATFNGFTKRLRPKSERVVPEYAGYFFRSPKFRQEVTAMSTLSTRASLNNEMLSRLSIALPSVAEQTAIGYTLKQFDDKIELNRRMNETLEGVARAIFKSWFVDFDPFRSKMEANVPVGGDHSRVFPDRMTDSEFGQVPAGWRYGTLSDVLGELVSGARPRGGAVESGVPSVGAENVDGIGRYDFTKEKFIPEEFFEQLRLKGADVRPGDVLLYKDGANVGRKSYVDRGFPHERCVVNEHVFIVRSDRQEWQRFLYCWLDQPWVTAEIVALNSNSAQPGINQTGVKSLPLLRPSDEVVIRFDALVAPLTDRLFSNLKQSVTLGGIRDALLPKLVAGQIRIRDVEKVVEAAI